MRATSLSLILAGLLMGGCGQGQSKDTGKPLEQGIITSANECTELHNLKLEVCQKAIATAIAEHERLAPTYSKLDKCEAAEGPERCERAGRENYSRRLQAFLISVAEPPKAAPLYATKNGKTGFIGAKGEMYSDDDDKLKFSGYALSLASRNAELRQKERKGAF